MNFRAIKLSRNGAIAAFLVGLFTALIGFVGGMLGDLPRPIVNWAVAPLLVALVGALALSAVHLDERGHRLARAAWCSAALTVCSLPPLVMSLIDSASLWRATTGAGVTAALAIAHWVILAAIPSRVPLFRLLRIVAVVSGQILAAVTLVIITRYWVLSLPSHTPFADALHTVTAMTIFASIGSTLLAALAAQSVKRNDPEFASTLATTQFAMRCPRCESLQTAGPGIVECFQCRALVEVHIREPRCSCGYPIFHWADERCPECGEVPFDAGRRERLARAADSQGDDDPRQSD